MTFDELKWMAQGAIKTGRTKVILPGKDKPADLPESISVKTGLFKKFRQPDRKAETVIIDGVNIHFVYDNPS